MKKAKTHKIWTIQDIANAVTADNKAAFLKEFDYFLEAVILAKAGYEIAGQAEVNIGPFEIKSFTWIDDGKNEGKITLSDSGGDSLEIIVNEN